MKTLSSISLILVMLTVALTGCDKAQEAAENAANEASNKVADMSNIDFGDFDMTGMQEKINGITDGLKDVSSDNVEGITTKISEFTSSLDGMGIDKLTGTAKTAVTGVMSTFGATIKSALEGITDEGILSKLKPVIDALMEKISSFTS
ncbi:MAG: hypothetical protein AAFN77_19120 [Planctomycetota bacterium]